MSGGEAFSVRSSLGPVERCLIGVAAVILCLLAATSASANTFTASGPFQVPDSPLAGAPACAGLVAQQESLGSTNYAGAEVEPYVALGPNEPEPPGGQLPAGSLERRRL